MSTRSIVAAVACSAIIGSAGALPASAQDILLTDVGLAVFPTPIGIDYHEPTNTMVFSVNYSSGLPNNFARIDANGVVSAFSTASGFTNEVKIATARSGNPGGFPGLSLRPFISTRFASTAA